jgi:outer membrane receptor protein involved in Fe transport
MPMDALATKMGRTKASLFTRANILGLVHGYHRKWTEEEIRALRIAHDFGSIKAQVTGMYQRNAVDSSVDYNQSVFNPAVANAALTTARAVSAGIPGLTNVVNAISSGSQFCTSQPEETGLGAYGGFRDCFSTPQDFDRSNQIVRAKTVEAIINSEFDGKFNFLIGGIYVNTVLPENRYYVNSWGIDYLVGVLGAANRGFLGTPFFRNNTRRYTLESYGVFGEAYFNFTDTVKLTAGLRYNSDKKDVSARSTLASFFVPFGTTGSAFNSPAAAGFDGDPNRPGIQAFSNRNVSFSEVTGRVVLDWKISDDAWREAVKQRGEGPLDEVAFDIWVPDGVAVEYVRRASYAPQRVGFQAQNTVSAGFVQNPIR